MSPIDRARLYETLRGGETRVADLGRKYALRFQHLGCRTVLDVGCGRGEFLQNLAALGIEAVGVDADPSMVRGCRDKGFTRVHLEDALSFLESGPISFDGIFCSHLIEHLPPEAGLSLIERCHDRLADGGILILVTPNPAHLGVLTGGFWLDLDHRRPWPRALLEAVMREAGFEVLEAGGDPETVEFREKRRHRFLGGLLLGGWYRQLRQHLVTGRDLFVIARKTERPR